MAKTVVARHGLISRDLSFQCSSRPWLLARGHVVSHQTCDDVNDVSIRIPWSEKFERGDFVYPFNDLWLKDSLRVRF